jgi:membrane protein YqaA with SNARE-associated domain
MPEGSLFGLFVAAFLAATPIPFQSEIIFVGLLAADVAPLATLVIVASIGNVLGSCVTYALGRSLGHLQDHRWFPLSPPQMAKGELWFRRWGYWVLLVSWAPGGDIAVAMAGLLRVSFPVFLILIIIAKTLRYIVLGLGANGLLAQFGW